MKLLQRYHLLLLCLLGILSFLGTIISHERLLGQPGNTIDIFVNTLSTEFQDGSWGNTSNTIVNGEWQITITDPWGALRLRSEDAFLNGTSIENVGSIVFNARAVGQPGATQTVDVLFETSDGVYGPRYTVMLTDQMQSFTVVHDQTPIVGLVWQDRGIGETAFVLDNVYLELEDPLLPTPTPTVGAPIMLNVDPTDQRGAIDPHVYGISFANSQLAEELDLPINRWGGNATSRYNWEESVSNRASDWFFLNVPDDNVDVNDLPDTATFNDFIQQNQQTGTDTVLTIPMMGFVSSGRNNDCGFRVSIYGPQDATEPSHPDCGNGYSNGVPLLGASPTDTSIAVDETYVQDWISYIDTRYGNNAVGFYSLDNEPMLWNTTHRDVHPTAVGYDEIRDLTYQYGAAIKQTNPLAKTLGPVVWGWTAYEFSAKDQADGGPDWWQNPPDRNAHGGQPFLEWYLDQMALYEQGNGLRVLDYLDIHYYPQAPNVALSNNVSPQVQTQRLRSTRALWDPTYVDESWISDTIMLVPRMKQMIQTHYPGTKLAISEYNWGATGHINGALTQADVLGIFGREGLDMAMFWADPGTTDPVSYAFRMYRNYDGQGSKFGDEAIAATSSNEESVSIYAAKRDDGAVTIMLVNKSQTNVVTNLSVTGPGGIAEVFQYSEQGLGAIEQLADKSIVGNTTPSGSSTIPPASIAMIPNSIQLLVFTPSSDSTPGMVMQISPNTTIPPSLPTFVWRPDPIATGYTIVLYNETTSAIDFMSSTPYSASTVCTGSNPSTDTCSVQPALALDSGPYKWLVRAVNGSVLGPWSSFP